MGQRLSGGIRRLVGFAMVTVWPGPVVILDEPTNDVDPLRRRSPGQGQGIAMDGPVQVPGQEVVRERPPLGYPAAVRALAGCFAATGCGR